MDSRDVRVSICSTGGMRQALISQLPRSEQCPHNCSNNISSACVPLSAQVRIGICCFCPTQQKHTCAFPEGTVPDQLLVHAAETFGGGRLLVVATAPPVPHSHVTIGLVAQ